MDEVLNKLSDIVDRIVNTLNDFLNDYFFLNDYLDDMEELYKSLVTTELRSFCKRINRKICNVYSYVPVFKKNLPYQRRDYG